LPVLGAGGVAYAKAIEPEWLEFTERECPLRNLTSSLELVHLSDIHASPDVPNSLIEKSLGSAIDARPDIVCITGDFVTGKEGFDARWYASALRRLTAAAPTFAVLGNHDGGPWSKAKGGLPTTVEVRRILEQGGVRLLDNQCQIIRAKSGAEIQVAGVGDLWAQEFEPFKAFSDAVSETPTIVLSHNPDTKTALGEFRWELMLSGHTHGGQVVAPLLGFNPAPVEDRNYIAGMKPWRDRWIHISRGVGNIGGVRFNCRPEITRIRLVPAAMPAVS
jgi:predicted MPP superfamily phosphohydrolase